MKASTVGSSLLPEAGGILSHPWSALRQMLYPPGSVKEVGFAEQAGFRLRYCMSENRGQTVSQSKKRLILPVMPDLTRHPAT